MRWAGMKALTAVLLLTASLAGCGGSSGPSAHEKRAALDRWTRTADAACKKANDAIADRGWPVNLVDLDRLTVRAIADVQAATKTIRSQKAPAGSEDKVRPFVKSLEELDGAMETLSTATEKFKIARLEKFLPKLGGALQEVESTSKELGLRECAAHQEHVFLPDAIRAPVFAQQLADLDRKLTKRTKRLNAGSASTPEEAARSLRELSDIADTYARRLDDLQPPYWARRQSDDYVTVLRTLGRVLDKGAKALASPPISPAEASRYERELARAGKAERKGIKKLLKSIGAIPTVKGRGGEEAPGGDETEAA
jgi:vacuolar-type H+-ATPase subunit I/STV1